jgi:hypothetical protein
MSFFKEEIHCWKSHTIPYIQYMWFSRTELCWAVVDDMGSIVPTNAELMFQFYREDPATYRSEFDYYDDRRSYDLC